MTNSELLNKLYEAQNLLSDVYHYACETGNSSLEDEMSCADDCIIEAISLITDENDGDYDGQPDESQEWHDFDPDC